MENVHLLWRALKSWVRRQNVLNSRHIVIASPGTKGTERAFHILLAIELLPFIKLFYLKLGACICEATVLLGNCPATEILSHSITQVGLPLETIPLPQPPK